ncbi:MAG TPA: pitrilysin family protein [Microlunatus sp.]|nr:pitrilysin family protein [Microlunatus sp.]
MSSFPARPVVAPPAAWSFPTPLRSTTSNGLALVVHDLPGQHVVSAHFVLPVGLENEDRGHEGVATITARTLDEGTEAHPGEEFAELLETEGAGFGVDVSLAGIQTVLDVPASRLAAALPLFAEAIIAPALADADVTRHVQLRLAEIEQAKANASHLASMAFREAVFDPASRASRMTAGEPETVAEITPDHARSFHAGRFGPRDATVVLAGDFRGADVGELVERAFGGWQVTGQLAGRREEPAAALRRSVLVDRPGSVQADVRLGGFGVDRSSPQWAAISVASYAMGGAFLSRLNAVLREEKGYTYGVRFGFSPLRAGGTYALQGSFRTEVVADALVTARELLDLSGTPITAAEVTDAITYFVGVSPLRYATADGVADQAASQVLNELGDDWVDRNLAAVAAVTPETATIAYEELVHLDDLTLVVVGDAEKLAEPLRAAGFGDLEVRSVGD